MSGFTDAYTAKLRARAQLGGSTLTAWWPTADIDAFIAALRAVLFVDRWSALFVTIEAKEAGVWVKRRGIHVGSAPVLPICSFSGTA